LYYLLNRFKKAARQNFAVFFFAQRGVTALVGTGGVAELEVSGFKGSFHEPLGKEVVLANSEVVERFPELSRGKTWGTDQEASNHR
jgi:hypothetical protein